MLLITEKVATSLLDLPKARACILDALEQLATGCVAQSEPRSLFLTSEEHGNRYHVKGAYLTKDSVVGFRLRL
jgi:hypothetical protein